MSFTLQVTRANKWPPLKYMQTRVYWNLYMDTQTRTRVYANAA